MWCMVEFDMGNQLMKVVLGYIKDDEVVVYIVVVNQMCMVDMVIGVFFVWESLIIFNGLDIDLL